MLLAKFQVTFYPTRNLAVNETMVVLRGKFSPKQYNMLNKATKYGIKAFTLAKSENGYTFLTSTQVAINFLMPLPYSQHCHNQLGLSCMLQATTQIKATTSSLISIIPVFR